MDPDIGIARIALNPFRYSPQPLGKTGAVFALREQERRRDQER
jgi:hypothetical protein